MEKYTLKQIEKKFNLPVRKASFLIRKDLITPIVEGSRILITENEINRYLGLPKTERKKHHTSFLKTLGPGVITAAADDDSSGVVAYTTVGAQFGLGLAWLAAYLLPMMSAVQETCARIGIVTGKGLAGSISKHFGKKVLYPLVLLLFIANTINIGADIGAMSSVLSLLFPVNFYLGAIGFTIFMLFLVINFSYHTYSRILKWLTIVLFSYIITGFLSKPDWFDVAKSLVIPQIQLNVAFLVALVAVMGTTISPYLFFWQASEEVEEERDKKTLSNHQTLALKKEIKEMRKDTYTGMTFANLVFLFIVITTSTVFHSRGITNINSAAEAATALRPLAGEFSYLLFAVGIIGVSLLAIPVLAGSSAYAIAELFKWHEGLYRRYSKAKGFYDVIIFSMLIGLGLNFIGVNPIKALYYAAVLNGIIAPILLFFIFKIGRDKKIMGQFTNPRWVNIWGTITTILMGGGALALIIFLLIGA